MNKPKSYVLTRDFKAAYVVATGMPHKPQAVKAKLFRKGEIVNGVLKYDNKRPAFVLVGSTLVLPLEVLQEVVTKQIGFDGTGAQKAKQADVANKKVILENPKHKYVDAILLGALIGGLGVYLAERKGWIQNQNPKNKIYGAVAGAALACYVVYRKNRKVTVKTA